MENTVGAKHKTVAQRRKVMFRLALVILVAGALVGFLIGIHPSGGAKQLEMGFAGPAELKVVWEKAVVGPLPHSIFEGWIINVSDNPVRFRSIIYRVKDQNGKVLWEERDNRFAGVNTIGTLGKISFVCRPILREGTMSFELMVDGEKLLNR
ncbi:MAG: hypothetical protein WC749_06350 [Dehalococcoidia bacterium]